MSEIHVREKDTMDKTANCIFHFAVPATTNSAGIAWNEVIQKAMTPEPLMPDNDTTENAQITAGSILELSQTVRFSTINLTNTQRIAEIKSAYSAKKLVVFSELGDKLDFFGTTLNV